MMLRANGGSGRGRAVWALAACVAVCGVMSSGRAQAESLLDALAAAYQYNPRLDAERARLRGIDEDVARANSGYRPQIDFNADVGRTNTTVRPNNGNAGSTSPRGYSFQVVQPVFRGFQTTNAVNETEAAVRAGRETLRGVEQDTLLQAVDAYASVVRDQNIVRLRESGLEFFNQELKATEDRFAVGEVTRTDVSQAQARRALAIGELDGARANLKTSRAQFEQVVGHAPERLTEPNWNIKLLPRSLDEAIGIGARENPLVVGALYREQAARFTVERIRGELLPSAQVEASYSDRFDSSRNIDEVETTSVVGRVNVPIYTGGEVEARVRQAKHNHIGRIQDIESARSEAQATVQHFWAQFIGQKAQLESDRAQIEFLRIALNGVREEEKVGQRTLLDVLNARQELLAAEVKLESTKRNTTFIAYQVIAAIGRLNVAELGAVGTIYDPAVHTDEVRRKWFGIDITHDDGRHERLDVWHADVQHEPVK